MLVGVFVAEAAESLVPGQGGTNDQHDVEVAAESAWDSLHHIGALSRSSRADNKQVSGYKVRERVHQ